MVISLPHLQVINLLFVIAFLSIILNQEEIFHRRIHAPVTEVNLVSFFTRIVNRNFVFTLKIAVNVLQIFQSQFFFFHIDSLVFFSQFLQSLFLFICIVFVNLNQRLFLLHNSIAYRVNVWHYHIDFSQIVFHFVGNCDQFLSEFTITASLSSAAGIRFLLFQVFVATPPVVQYIFRPEKVSLQFPDYILLALIILNTYLKFGVSGRGFLFSCHKEFDPILHVRSIRIVNARPSLYFAQQQNPFFDWTSEKID